MRSATILALACLAAPAAGAGDRLRPAEMATVADRFDRAQIAKDAAALDNMVDPALVFIDGTGARRDKAAFIAGWTAPGDRFDPPVLTDRRFTPLGRDAFVVSAHATLTGVSDGRPFTSGIRFSDTFRRYVTGWRAVHIHVTRAAAVPPPS